MMNSPCQFCCHHPSSMIAMPQQQSYHQPLFTTNQHFQYQQPYFQHQSHIQQSGHQQYMYEQQYYHQQVFSQQHYPQQIHQQQFQSYMFNYPQPVPVIFNNANALHQVPVGQFSQVYPQQIRNSITPQNYQITNELQFSTQPVASMTVIHNEKNMETIPEETKAIDHYGKVDSVKNSNQYEIKQEQQKDRHELSTSQQNINIKEESIFQENSQTRAPKIENSLLIIPKKQQFEDVDEKMRTSSKTTQEMMVSIDLKCELKSAEKSNANELQSDNESGEKEQIVNNIKELLDNTNNYEKSISESEKKPVPKEKSISLKAEKRKMKDNLIEISNSAQKELLLEIQQISKQSPAKALLKAFVKYGLGKQEYIYNYDISENQYYYKLCHDMPLLRIEDPSKKDLEGFYRKLKKFFQGKQYNNSTLKTVVRNKLYGQLFDDFLHTQVEEWIKLTKSKNKDDIRLIIRFLLLCHENTDYLIFLRETDKSKGKQRFEDLSE